MDRTIEDFVRGLHLDAYLVGGAVRAGGRGEGLGDHVVARVEVVVEQPEAGPRLAGDGADGGLGEAAALDDAPRSLDQLSPTVVGPSGPRGARRGR